jgi:hypothetical protein
MRRTILAPLQRFALAALIALTVGALERRLRKAIEKRGATV